MLLNAVKVGKNWVVSKARTGTAAVAVGASLVTTQANAAIDLATHLTPIGTEVSGDISTVFTWIMPIIGTMLAIMIGVKLVKRLANKV